MANSVNDAMLNLLIQQYGNTASAIPAQQEASWGRKFGRGIDTIQDALYGFARLGSDAAGLDTVSSLLDQARASNLQELQAGGWSDPWRNFEEGNYLRGVGTLLAEQAPQLGLGAGLAAVGAGPLGLGLARAAQAGAFAAAAPQMAGSLYNEGSSPEVAIAGGLASGLFNTIGMGGIIQSMGRAMTSAAAKGATIPVLKKIGKEFVKAELKNVGGESVSEGVDTTIEQMAKNLREGRDYDDFSPEQIKEIAKGATLGGIAGGAFGLPFNALDARTNQQSNKNLIAQQEAQAKALQDALGQSSTWVPPGEASYWTPPGTQQPGRQSSPANAQAEWDWRNRSDLEDFQYDDLSTPATGITPTQVESGTGPVVPNATLPDFAQDGFFGNLDQQLVPREPVEEVRPADFEPIERRAEPTVTPSQTRAKKGGKVTGTQDSGTVGIDAWARDVTARNQVARDRQIALEKMLEARSKRQATEQKTQADAFGNYLQWREQITMQNEKQKQERAKTAETQAKAQASIASQRSTVANDLEKLKAARIKNYAGVMKLQEQMQKMQQAQQETNQPKLSATEQKEQQQRQAAEAVTPQLMEQTTAILDPQAAQRKRQQAMQRMMNTRAQQATSAEAINRAMQQRREQQAAEALAAVGQRMQQRQMDNVRAIEADNQHMEALRSNPDYIANPDGSVSRTQEAQDRASRAMADFKRQAARQAVAESTAAVDARGTKFSHNDLTSRMKYFPAEVKKVTKSLPNLDKISGKNPVRLMEAVEKYEAAIVAQEQAARAAMRPSVKDGHLQAAKLIRRRLDSVRNGEGENSQNFTQTLRSNIATPQSVIEQLIQRPSWEVGYTEAVARAEEQLVEDAGDDSINAVRALLGDTSIPKIDIAYFIQSVQRYGSDIAASIITLKAYWDAYRAHAPVMQRMHKDAVTQIAKTLRNYPALQNRVCLVTECTDSSGGAVPGRRIIKLNTLGLFLQENANGEIVPRDNFTEFLQDVLRHEIGHAAFEFVGNASERALAYNNLYEAAQAQNPELWNSILAYYEGGDLRQVPLNLQIAEVAAIVAAHRADPAFRSMPGADTLIRIIENADTTLQSLRSNIWPDGRTDAGGQGTVEQNSTRTLSQQIGTLRAVTTPGPARNAAQVAQDSQDSSLFDFNRAWEDAQVRAADAKEAFLENFVDAMEPIRRMVASIKQTGRVTFESNTAKHAEALPNVTAQDLLEHHNKYVLPLEDAIVAYAKATGTKNNEQAYADVVEYWEAMAILERKQVIANTNPTAPEYMPERSYKSLNDSISKFSAADMMPIGKAIQNINEAKLNLLVAKKIVSAETAANFRAKYQNYMPLFANWDSMIEAIDPSWARNNMRKSLSAGRALEKFNRTVSANPGDWDIKDPLVATIKQMYDAVVLSNKVDVQRSLLKLSEQNPNSVMLQPVREQDTTRVAEYDEVTGTIVSRKLLRDIPTSSGGRRVIADNVVSCIDADGNLKRIEFSDARVARAFKGANITQLNTILQTAANAQKTIMQLMTGKSPLFWTTNPIRDFFTAALNSASLKKSLENVIDLNRTKVVSELFFKGLEDAYSLLPGTGTRGVRSALHHYYMTGDATFQNAPNIDPATRDYMSELPNFLKWGGSSSHFSGGNDKTIQKSILDAVKAKNPVTASNHARRAISAVADRMDAISDSLENKTRYIVFKETYDALFNGTRQPDNTHRDKRGNIISKDEMYARAANAAMNITVNFSKRGAYAPAMNLLYYFASANIAGNYRMFQTLFRRKPNGKIDWNNAGLFAGGLLTARLVSAALCRELMDDDDDGINFYDKISQYEKDSNIIIPSPLGGKDYLKIPLMYGFNILYQMGAIGDAIFTQANNIPGQTVGDAVLSVFASSLDNFNVAGKAEEGWNLLVPSTLRPFFQWQANKDFAGRPIMKEGTSAYGGKNIPDSERAWASMSKPVVEFCQWMNEITGGSQTKSGMVDVSPETLEHFATAYTGGIGRIAMTTAARVADLYRTGTMDPSRIAGYGTFIGEIRPSNDNVLFSGYRDVIQSAVNETKLAQTDKSLSPERKQELLSRNAKEYMLKNTLNAVQKELNDLTSAQRKLRWKPGNTDAQFDAIEEQKHSLRKHLIKKAVKAGIPSSL